MALDPGSFTSLVGIQRVRNANASDAHSGHRSSE